MTQEKFMETQKHNHMIMAEVTQLEQKALANLTNVDAFNAIIAEIDQLQAQYRSYGND